MLDILLLRKDLASAVARLESRKKPQAFLNVEAFQALEAERKTIQTRTEELQSQRNQLSKQIGALMGKGEKDAAEAAKAPFPEIDYGKCGECGEEISLKRLEARPETTLCIKCKEDQERAEKDFS